MQNENEELECLEECHPLPVHWHITAFILFQEFLAEIDQEMETRQPGCLIPPPLPIESGVAVEASILS